MKKIAFGMIAVAGLAASAMAQNTGATLTAGTHQFQLTTNGTGNLPTTTTGGNVTTNLRVGNVGTLNNMFNGNWFYRLPGDTRERTLHTATTRVLTGTSRVDYTYGSMFSGVTAVAGLSAGLSYELFDTGADSLALITTMTVNNASGADITLDLFTAYDMDLGGNNAPGGFAGDVVSPLDISGGNRTWIVNDTVSATSPTWRMYYQGAGAHGAGQGGFSAINSQMTDTSVDNFIPDLGAAGAAAGDYAYIMQYRVTIAAGGSYTASTQMAVGRNGVDPTLVPAPGALALLGLGGLVATRRRR